jgi:hypothetical protein
MRFLLSAAVNPKLSLCECLGQWRRIAYQLREPVRRRPLQLDALVVNRALLS